VGARLGIKQSEVSRLELRDDVRLSTLRSYVEAVGGWLRLIVAWPDGTDGAELVVGGERNPPTTGPTGRRGKIDA